MCIRDRDMERLYGDDSLMAKELRFFRNGLRNHVPLELLLADLGIRSGEPDIEDFAEVFSIAKRSGGNLNDIIRRSAAVTGEKIEVKQEIQTLLSSRRYEQKIMNKMCIRDSLRTVCKSSLRPIRRRHSLFILRFSIRRFRLRTVM